MYPDAALNAQSSCCGYLKFVVQFYVQVFFFVVQFYVFLFVVPFFVFFCFVQFYVFFFVVKFYVFFIVVQFYVFFCFTILCIFLCFLNSVLLSMVLIYLNSITQWLNIKYFNIYHKLGGFLVELEREKFSTIGSFWLWLLSLSCPLYVELANLLDIFEWCLENKQ